MVPLGALETFSWSLYFFFMDSILLRGRDGTLVVARRAFVVSALSGLSRWRLLTEVSKELGLDAFQFCTKGEEKYVKWLVALDPSLVAIRAGCKDVDDGTMCFAKLQLGSPSATCKRLTRHIDQASYATNSGLARRQDTRFCISV